MAWSRSTCELCLVPKKDYLHPFLIPLVSHGTNGSADAMNLVELGKLGGATYTYVHVQWPDKEDKDAKEHQELLDAFPAPDTLTLRVGAQVMLNTNVDQDLINGTLGKVVRFERVQVAPQTKVIVKNSVDDVQTWFPVVEFSLSDGLTFQHTVKPFRFTVSDRNRRVLAWKSQVRLCIHFWSA